MKYLFYFFLSVCLFIEDIKAQNAVEVHYTQSITQHSIVTQPGILYYRDGQSMYIHSKGAKGNVMQNLDGTPWEGKDINAPFMSWHQDTIGAVFYKDYSKKKLHFRDFFNSTAYISGENFPTFTWNILRDVKKIGGYTCYKATTRFRGRHYTAWFTMDIPIQDGPWKFWGLPGLILEVSDSLNQVKFTAQSIIYPSKAIVKFEPPQNGKIVDLATYRKVGDVEYEKWRRANQAKDHGRGVQMSFSRKKVDNIEKEYEK